MIQKFNKKKQKYKNGDVLLPDSWVGYRIIPEKFKFWRGRKIDYMTDFSTKDLRMMNCGILLD
ncbi:MAG: pyridoxine/pyridoxamine 5'-phosphate oxidase [Saprospiraceae bacterium]